MVEINDNPISVEMYRCKSFSQFGSSLPIGPENPVGLVVAPSSTAIDDEVAIRLRGIGMPAIAKVAQVLPLAV